jgi:hypothetical protein
MTGTEDEPETDNKVSVLFRFYTWKVFSKIRPPEKTGPGRDPGRKNRDAVTGSWRRDR